MKALMPLSRDVADLLAIERRTPELPSDQTARLLARVEARLAGRSAAAGAAPVPAGPPPVSGIAAALGAKTWIVGLAVVSSLGLATGAALFHRRRAPSPPPAATGLAWADPASDVAHREGGGAEALSTGRPTPVLGTAGSADGPRISSRLASGHSPRLSEGNLAAESALIDRACAALARDDVSTALEALDRHRRHFAAGALAEERDALEIKARARGGSLEEARRRTRAFERRYPGSVQMQSINEALRARP